MGYQLAKSQGSTVIGTLTILLMAKKAGIIQAIKPLLDDRCAKAVGTAKRFTGSFYGTWVSCSKMA